MAGDHYIELVGKVVGLVESLRDQPEGLSLQELAARTGYVKSSIHRILHSLKKHGYVEQENAGGPYKLGVQFLALARGLNGAIKLPSVARPYLRELVQEFDESAYLALLRAGRGIFIDVQETHRDLMLVGPLGAEVYYHATAAGKAMAAFLPPRRRAALLKRLKLKRLTERTITRRSLLEKEWARVRRMGFAVNNEETIVGAVFLAAPVFDSRQAVCGSISVGIPKPRFSAPLGRKIARHLKGTSHRLSAALRAAGYVHKSGGNF